MNSQRLIIFCNTHFALGLRRYASLLIQYYHDIGADSICEVLRFDITIYCNFFNGYDIVLLSVIPFFFVNVLTVCA